jgi:hypothetical protein
MPSPAANLALIILAVLAVITLVGIVLRTQIDVLVKRVQGPEEEITTAETAAVPSETVQEETAR